MLIGGRRKTPPFPRYYYFPPGTKFPILAKKIHPFLALENEDELNYKVVPDKSTNVHLQFKVPISEPLLKSLPVRNREGCSREKRSPQRPLPSPPSLPPGTHSSSSSASAASPLLFPILIGQATLPEERGGEEHDALEEGEDGRRNGGCCHVMEKEYSGRKVSYV